MNDCWYKRKIPQNGRLHRYYLFISKKATTRMLLITVPLPFSTPYTNSMHQCFKPDYQMVMMIGQGATSIASVRVAARIIRCLFCVDFRTAPCEGAPRFIAFL